MNEFKAIVKVFSNYLKYQYKIGEEIYNIEVPKTDKNSMLKNGDEITVFLAMSLEK